MCYDTRFNFDVLLDKEGLNASQKKNLMKAIQKFHKVDNTILYLLTIILIIIVFSLLYILSKTDEHLTILMICGFMVIIAVVLTMARIWNFKFYQANPIVGMWGNPSKVKGDRFYLGITLFASVISIILMIATAVVLIKEEYDLGVTMTIVTCAMFIIVSLFYRLHAGTYIAYAQNNDISSNGRSAVMATLA